jgi:hypothetical protein
MLVTTTQRRRLLYICVRGCRRSISSLETSVCVEAGSLIAHMPHRKRCASISSFRVFVAAGTCIPSVYQRQGATQIPRNRDGFRCHDKIQFYPQKLALTSSTSGGRSTRATERLFVKKVSPTTTALHARRAGPHPD